MIVDIILSLGTIITSKMEEQSDSTAKDERRISHSAVQVNSILK